MEQQKLAREIQRNEIKLLMKKAYQAKMDAIRGKTRRVSTLNPMQIKLFN